MFPPKCSNVTEQLRRQQPQQKEISTKISISHDLKPHKINRFKIRKKIVPQTENKHNSQQRRRDKGMDMESAAGWRQNLALPTHCQQQSELDLKERPGARVSFRARAHRTSQLSPGPT